MPPKKHLHLSPEEKRELKRKKKLERKLKKAERKRQLKRDHLAREVRYGRVTYKNYEKDWREMLIKMTLPRMRNELEFAWHNFERTVDCKDFTISLLMDELKDSEEQYMHNFRAHSENMDKLLGIFDDRLDELRRDFEDEVRQMEERLENEVDQIKKDSGENLDYLKTMLYELELQRKEHIRLKRGEYIGRLDESDGKNQLQLQKLKANLENKYQTMFDAMKNFIKQYHKNIRDRKKEHNLLKSQDDSMQELIGQQFRHIRNCQNRIRQLRQNLVDMKQTEGNRLADLQEERLYFANNLLALKTKIEKDKKDDFNRLGRLSYVSAQILDFLDRLNKKGEMILSLAAVCRKLETEKEKIKPFPLSITGLERYTDKDIDETDKIKEIKPEMELFWQRLGQAHGVHYTLSREKEFLKEANELILATHMEYCERLMYPPIRPYTETVSIPRCEAINVVKNQAKSRLHRQYVYLHFHK